MSSAEVPTTTAAGMPTATSSAAGFSLALGPGLRLWVHDQIALGYVARLRVAYLSGSAGALDPTPSDNPTDASLTDIGFDGAFQLVGIFDLTCGRIDSARSIAGGRAWLAVVASGSPSRSGRARRRSPDVAARLAGRSRASIRAQRRARANAPWHVLPLGDTARSPPPPPTARSNSSCSTARALPPAPTRDAFAEHFKGAPDDGIVAFPNLGGDAIMVVPCEIAAPSAYAHLAAFVRGAPAQQRHALWQRVAHAMLGRLNAVSPSGSAPPVPGVSWLHVRPGRPAEVLQLLGISPVRDAERADRRRKYRPDVDFWRPRSSPFWRR